MNYKNKALEHVRSVCTELMELSFGCQWKINGESKVYVLTGTPETEPRYDYKIIGHTPHLEHWLRGIAKAPNPKQENIYGFLSDGVLQNESRTYGHTEEVTYYNLTKDGENQSEEFYKAYCEIVGV